MKIKIYDNNIKISPYNLTIILIGMLSIPISYIVRIFVIIFGVILFFDMSTKEIFSFDIDCYNPLKWLFNLRLLDCE